MSLNTCRVSSSSRSVLWNRSCFPVVVGERGWVSRCSMPFSRQIRSNSTSTGGCAKRPVNTLPLSVSTWSGTPYLPQRQAESLTDLAGPFPMHQARRHAEPRVVVQPGQGLGGGAIGEMKPADHVQLPQLHRRAPLPPFPVLASPPPRRRLNHARPEQAAIDRGGRRGRGHAFPGQLQDQSTRAPERLVAPHLQHPHLDEGRHL